MVIDFHPQKAFTPLISIIIPVVRNDPHVKEAVEHIERSTYRNYEILIVDEGQERSAQRNIGMDRAKGQFYLILDSDMMISPYLLQECVNKMGADIDCVGLYIPERIVTKGWFGRLRDWERQFYTATLVDVVRFVRAKDCPRFDETLHGVEDSSWERQIKGTKRVTTWHFNHHDKCGLIKFLKKKCYYAQCIDAYKKKNPDDRLITFKYRCWQVFVENGKYKRLIRHPIKATGVALLLLARGMILLCRKKS